MKTTYTARFSNGLTVTRTSATKSYTHAWRVQKADDSNYSSTGFAVGFDKADKAAHGLRAHWRKFGIDVAQVEIVEVKS